MGDIVSDAYYVMYDYSTKQIGFNGFVLTGLPIIEGGHKQKEPESGGLSTFGAILILIAAIAFVVALVYFAFKKTQDEALRKKLMEDGMEEEDDEAAAEGGEKKERVEGETGEKKKVSSGNNKRNIDEIDIDDY